MADLRFRVPAKCLSSDECVYEIGRAAQAIGIDVWTVIKGAGVIAAYSLANATGYEKRFKTGEEIVDEHFPHNDMEGIIESFLGDNLSDDTVNAFGDGSLSLYNVAYMFTNEWASSFALLPEDSLYVLGAEPVRSGLFVDLSFTNAG